MHGKEGMFEGIRILKRFTWVNRIKHGRSLLGFIIVQECDRNRHMDGSGYRRAGRGISDHHLVEAKINA